MENYKDVESKFIEIFKKATEHTPFPYQIKFAISKKLPKILDIPTGCGKTNAIILSWIWRRLFSDDEIKESTPRRLVYCLPTRVLVWQVKKNAEDIIKRLELQDKISINILMGGESGDNWDYYPEKDAIIIGTQDMLISRALNRGYGMSKFRWPIHYAFLNNDSFWVIDEMQLMGSGLETTAQLQAFRDYYGCYGNSTTIWTSATACLNRIKTIDYKDKVNDNERLELSEEDYRNEIISKVINASKEVKYYIKDDKFYKDYFKAFADKLVQSYEEFKDLNDNILILGILNTVDRAKEVYKQIPDDLGIEKILLHSEFREFDREKKLKSLLEDNENKKAKIIISTQVIEAGVDISAAVLITELAPLSSLIQRFGRCNRKGEYKNSKIYLTNPLSIKINLKDKRNNKKEDNALPYLKEEIDASEEYLADINAKISNLNSVIKNNHFVDSEIHPVIRKRDFIDLFDTTSDLNGKDIDISKYIRDDSDNDVQVFWRDNVECLIKNPDKIIPLREELCSVPIYKIKDLVNSNTPIYKWDYSNGKFDKVRRDDILVPGQIFMLDTNTGMYSPDIGWTGKKEDKVNEYKKEIIKDYDSLNDSINKDPLSYIHKNVELKKHLFDVKNKALQISNSLGLDENISNIIGTAALWHDVGKAHKTFQEKLRLNNPYLPTDVFWAKSVKKRDITKESNNIDKKGYRKYFRHELASALAWLSVNKDSENKYLIAYLIAAHHGKINMIIRSLPQESFSKEDLNKHIALGVQDGDHIGPFDDLLKNEIDLDLSIMDLGKDSWLSNIIKLRDDPKLGPIKLVYYSSIVRIADWIASDEENKLIGDTDV